MKAYNYFLFRIYKYYTDKENESEKMALFSVTAVSTVMISFVFLILHGVLNYFDLVQSVTNNLLIILFVLIVGVLNYYFFVKNKKFLEYGFLKDKRGGLLVISFILTLGIFFLVLANYNRAKIFEQNVNVVSKESQKESLEAKVKRYFE